MDTQQAYDQWAAQYDTNENKTRDLEAVALREMLGGHTFGSALEIGCGTGKNTTALLERCDHITAVDLSEEMLGKARQKISDKKAIFIQADILQAWDFAGKTYDLVIFSLVLEHIEHLTPILQKAAAVLKTGGSIYIGELHPFKQYSGSKARFDTAEGVQGVPCFNHHLSDFTAAAAQAGLQVDRIEEYFDDNDRTRLPRLLTMLLRK